MREIQEEHRKFITETRQKKNMKKPGKKSKQYRNELIRIAAEAREHGMSYGQYVGLMYCEERDEMERRRRYDRKKTRKIWLTGWIRQKRKQKQQLQSMKESILL